jgi:3-oxosteroid 1-dehydrogenase
MFADKVSRRGFLKGTAVGAGALAVAGINLNEVRAAEQPKTWTAEADVIVVGLGVAGATAAIEAAEAGAKVLLLEKGPGASGATPVSSGTVWLPLNPLQQHPDSVEDVIKYLKNCAKDQADDALIRTFAENTKETAEWLLNKIGLKATQPNRFDYHPSYPGAGRGRNISSQGAGAGLMTVLINAAKARKVEIRTGVRARRLVIDGQGRVIGVMGEKPAEAYKATRAVILCAGGFSSNEAMKKSFLKVYPAYGQVPGLMGDGILMGMGGGAAVEGMSEFIGVTVFPIPGRERGARFFIMTAPSCIMVNRKGQRFCNESADYDTVSASYYAYDTLADDYANVPAWLIFDEQVRTKGPASPAPGWSKDNLEEIKKGWIKKADSLAELATQTGINEQALLRTIDTFNQNAAQGKDPLFGRGEIPGTPGVAKLSGPPYYSIQVYPGLYDTAGGLKINAKSQVMNPFGEVIKHLYAAGTTAHMAIGFYYPNGGTAIGQPLVFGRIAGKTAAAEEPV